MAEVEALIPIRSLEIKGLDVTVAKEEVIVAPCRALSRSDFGEPCRLYDCFGWVRAAVIQLTEADAQHLLRLGKLRIR